METIEFATGRTYDTPQTLIITVEAIKTDEWHITEIRATFRDTSRGISGRVNVIAFDGDNIGAEVLAAYDAGQYDAI